MERISELERALGEEGLTVREAWQDPSLQGIVQKIFDKHLLQQYPRLRTKPTSSDYEAHAQLLLHLSESTAVRDYGKQVMEKHWAGFLHEFIPIVQHNGYDEETRDLLINVVETTMGETRFDSELVSYAESVEAWKKWGDECEQIKQELEDELQKKFKSPTKARNVMGVIKYTKELTEEEKKEILPMRERLDECAATLRKVSEKLGESESELLKRIVSLKKEY